MDDSFWNINKVYLKLKQSLSKDVIKINHVNIVWRGNFIKSSFKIQFVKTISILNKPNCLIPASHNLKFENIYRLSLQMG